MNCTLTAALGPVTCSEYLTHIGALTAPLPSLENACTFEMDTAFTSEQKQIIEAFRAERIAKGETILSWCKQQGISYDSTMMVLRGRAQGRRGDAHLAMVALGLKPAPKK